MKKIKDTVTSRGTLTLVLAVVVGTSIISFSQVNEVLGLAGTHREKKLTANASVTGTTWTGISGISITGRLHNSAVDHSTINFKYFADTACTGNQFYAREVYVANSVKFFMTEINGVQAGQPGNGSVSASTEPTSTVSHDYWLEIRNGCSGGTATVYAGSMQNLSELWPA
jgi:hypothetical protein